MFNNCLHSFLHLYYPFFLEQQVLFILEDHIFFVHVSLLQCSPFLLLLLLDSQHRPSLLQFSLQLIIFFLEVQQIRCYFAVQFYLPLELLHYFALIPQSIKDFLDLTEAMTGALLLNLVQYFILFLDSFDLAIGEEGDLGVRRAFLNYRFFKLGASLINCIAIHLLLILFSHGHPFLSRRDPFHEVSLLAKMHHFVHNEVFVGEAVHEGGGECLFAVKGEVEHRKSQYNYSQRICRQLNEDITKIKIRKIVQLLHSFSFSKWRQSILLVLGWQWWRMRRESLKSWSVSFLEVCLVRSFLLLLRFGLGICSYLRGMAFLSKFN